MLDIKYYIKGIEANPANHKEISVQLNFDRDNGGATPSVSTNKWKFENNDSKILNDHIDTGLNGGVGINEGVPFSILLTNGNKSIKFEHYLDLAAEDTVLSCNEIECNSVDLGNIDWLNTKADSVSFRYLYEKTNFLPASFNIPIPYVISAVPNYKDAIICSVSIFTMGISLYQAINDLAATVAAAGGIFNSLGEVLRLVVKILYVVILLAFVIRLVKQLILLIIQPVKYHAAMYVLDQAKAAAKFLGLEFKSTILEADPWNRSVILPEKFENPEYQPSGDGLDDLKILGFDKPSPAQNGYYNGTFGDLLRALKKIFKGKLVFEGNVLRLEKRNYKTSNTPIYTIPDILQTKFKTNAGKFASTYFLEFSVDFDDKNTVQQYGGTVLQATTQAKIVTDPKLNLIRNFERVTIPFCLAKRKTELTGPEKILNAFFKIFSPLIKGMVSVTNDFIRTINATIIKPIKKIFKVLNNLGLDLNVPDVIKDGVSEIRSGEEFKDIINDRIGMLLLETDLVAQPKIFILKPGSSPRQNHIDEVNGSYYNARYLWDNFHNVISQVPTVSYPNADQWRQKTIEKVPFTFDDMIKVLNNSPIFDAEGNEARIISLSWNYWEQLAKIDYEINKKFTDNLILTLHDGKGY